MERGDDLHGDDSVWTSQRTRTFIVRIWFEPRGDERGPMRGTLAYLGGPMLGAFQSMAGLASLLEHALASHGPVDDPPTGKPRA